MVNEMGLDKIWLARIFPQMACTDVILAAALEHEHAENIRLLASGVVVLSVLTWFWQRRQQRSRHVSMILKQVARGREYDTPPYPSRHA